jgi:preprotein translocase subunit SecY
MEVFLLWIDELDDALGAARHLAPKFIGFLSAIALFAGTVFALSLAPQVTLSIVGVVLTASLGEAVRRRLSRIAADRQG